ncbi:MAG: Sua5/YciO/YrdC/YwlC family protein [Gammaproteobacteria bacterium]
MATSHLQAAIDAIQAGKVIAYPTESVFGLGCLPLNQSAVMEILELKQRSVTKGLICVAYSIEQLDEFVDFSMVSDMQAVTDSWPGPCTWLVPARSSTPAWLTGDHTTLAVRISAYPVVRKLCEKVGPLVSTSANPQGMLPANSDQQVRAYFGSKLGYIYPAELPTGNKPTEIRDALSGKVVRNS